MKTLKTYWHPTPIKARRWGDAFLLLSASLSGAVMGLPIEDFKKLWINFALTLIGVIGKIITNFASDEPINTQP